MKTTIEISNSLFEEAKQTARSEGITMRELFEQGLRRELEERAKSKPKFKLRDGAVNGEGMIAQMSWPEMRAIIYEGRGE